VTAVAAPLLLLFALKNGVATGLIAELERDPETLARPWAIPGTPGLEHRIGGIEKSHIQGNVNYDPENHDYMCRIRAAKIALPTPGSP